MVEHIEQVHGTYQATINTHDMWHVIIGCRVTSPKKSIEELHHKIFLYIIHDYACYWMSPFDNLKHVNQ